MMESHSVSDGWKWTERFVAEDRSYLSIQHIQSAALFARQCAVIEQAYNGVFDDDLFTDHRAYVVGAIFTASAFLEGTINELFLDAVDSPYSEFIQQLPSDVRDRLAEAWKECDPQGRLILDRKPILEKFQTALTLSGKEEFERGVALYQDAADLIELRDALFHPKPEWVTVIDTAPEPKNAAKDKGPRGSRLYLAQRLRAKNFALNPMVSLGNFFFPDKCLGHGCADWAVT